jgi:hypothetical protein
MSSERSPSPTSLETARRLLARDAAPGRVGDQTLAADALQRSCSRVFDNLRDAMGDDGCTALLARALARTEDRHPALKDMRRYNDGSIHLDGVVAAVEAHGVTAVTAATEALLAALVDVLARLIGEDMAIRLIDHDAAGSRTNGKARAP